MIKKETVNLIAFILIGIIILCSCNGSKDKEYDKEVTQAKNYPLREKIFAVYTDTGSGKKVPSIVMRVINKVIKYDSLTKKDVIKIDTIFGIERIFQNGVDSAGKPKYSSDYFLIGRDSINWRVEGKNIDSLLKK